MDDFRKLGELMKRDWDRRISHDYRFWMSDGYRDDDTMWQSGERDLDILLAGAGDIRGRSVLEIGCGVGRLLRAALRRGAVVTGLDVSEQAVSKARELLADWSNLTLVVGNGYNLQPLQDSSIDIAISFAAITSIPTDVIANYLCEISRVLKPGGTVRLQCYLGQEQRVDKDDTLHPRCYRQDNFIRAASFAGFNVESIQELVLPFQVSYKEAGIEAVIVSLSKRSVALADSRTIAATLLPEGEADDAEEDRPRELEYWMSLNYARELTERGDLEKARAALEYSAHYAKIVSVDLRDLFTRIGDELERKERERAAAPPAAAQVTAGEVRAGKSEFLERNLRVLKERFPEAARLLGTEYPQTGIEMRDTPEGAVVYQQGQCLDHPMKPKAGAASWVKRAFGEEKVRQSEHLIIYGFGCGYHLEEFLAASQARISVIEPNPAVFAAALASRDLTGLLQRLHGLSVGKQESVPFVDELSDLCVRPQSGAVEADYCSRIKALFYGARGFTSLHPKIGVLGPLQGGTLPIAGYTARALQGLRQRVRELDVSGFAGGFHLVDSFVKEDLRRLTMHGHYLEMVSQVLLESLTEKPVDILLCLAQAPISGRVLTELRKRGVITVLWFVEDYLRFVYWRDLAQHFDFVFTIQKGECIDAIKAAGAGAVHYLPTGCDPSVHCPMILSEEDRQRWGSPVSFVGAGYHNRQQMFASLCEFPLKIWGTEWPGCRPFDRMVQEQGRRLAPEEYVKIFNATDVNINLHSSTERDGVDPTGDFLNPRTFELAAAGAFQLVDQRRLLPEVFEGGREVITFRSLPELKEQINYYLAHPEERARISSAARERALREHTYDQRLKAMLSIIYAGKYELLRQREEHGPWGKLLRRAKPHPELYERCWRAFQIGEEPKLDALVAGIVTGQGVLTETEQKLLFLHHIRSQIIRMRREEAGDTGG